MVPTLLSSSPSTTAWFERLIGELFKNGGSVLFLELSLIKSGSHDGFPPDELKIHRWNLDYSEKHSHFGTPPPPCSLSSGMGRIRVVSIYSDIL